MPRVQVKGTRVVQLVADATGSLPSTPTSGLIMAVQPCTVPSGAESVDPPAAVIMPAALATRADSLRPAMAAPDTPSTMASAPCKVRPCFFSQGCVDISLRITAVVQVYLHVGLRMGDMGKTPPEELPC